VTNTAGEVDGVELVLVSYHSADQVAGLLAGLPAQLAVAVVDNASGADGADAIVEARNNARYVDSGGGQGYAKAANLGARTSTAEYLVFGNPDSRPTVDVIAALVANLRLDPSCATVSAVTVDEHGRADLGVGGWEPTLRRTIVHAFGLHKIVPSAGIWFPPKPGQVVEREWVSGGCMAVRRETFLALGGFDERYFVYNEDMAFGRRVRAAGFRQVLRGDLQVPHLGAGSGAGSSYMARMRGASLIAYLRHHHRPVTVEVMRVALVTGYLLRIAECALTRRWQRARGFIAYVRGLILGRGSLV
jgi:N-acetylglucosaminyl-diphospho-decaprenol L-rhamnosyltransferase